MKFLDPDRTYDILFAQKIKGQILALLTDALGTHSIFDYEFPICLIDRLVPSPISPWCEDWSGLMFEFLKKLSRTHILDDGNLNGSAYGFTPPYGANLPQTIDLSAYKVESLTVLIPANSEGIITWQERDHEPQSAPHCANLTNNLAITRRRGRVFQNKGGASKRLTLSCRNWLHNSVCVAGIQLQGLTENQSKFLLYDQMAEFLDYLWGLLGIPNNCKVLTGMTVNDTCQVKVSPRRLGIYTDNSYQSGIAVDSWAEYSEFFSFPTYSDPVFSSVPASYCNTSLIYANGEKLGANVVIRKTPLSVSFIQGDNYQRHAYDHPEAIPYKIFSQLEGLDLLKIELEMLNVESADGQVYFSGGGVNTYKYFYGFGNNLSVNLLGSSGAEINVTGYNSLGNFFTKTQARDGYSVEGSSVVNGETFTYAGEQSNQVEAMISYAMQYSLPPGADYNLFKSGDIVWIYNGMASGEIFNQTIMGMALDVVGSVGYFNYYGSLEISTYLKAITKGIKFTVDATDPYFFGVIRTPLAQAETVLHQDSLNSSFYTSQGYLPYFAPLFPDYRQHSYSVPLTRTLRSDPIPEIIIQF